MRHVGRFYFYFAQRVHMSLSTCKCARLLGPCFKTGRNASYYGAGKCGHKLGASLKQARETTCGTLNPPNLTPELYAPAKPRQPASKFHSTVNGINPKTRLTRSLVSATAPGQQWTGEKPQPYVARHGQTRQSDSPTYTSRSFHSLSRVLCTSPSRYLYAIDHAFSI